MIDKTLDLVKAYVATNRIDPQAFPGFIRDVHAALKGLDTPSTVPPLEGTVTDDYIICLEDGRKLQILKRHLRQRYNMTPEQYRQKWNLPSDYPMVAKSYGEKRSAIAKAQGLGRQNERHGTPDNPRSPAGKH